MLSFTPETPECVTEIDDGIRRIVEKQLEVYRSTINLKDISFKDKKYWFVQLLVTATEKHMGELYNAVENSYYLNAFQYWIDDEDNIKIQREIVYVKPGAGLTTDRKTLTLGGIDESNN